MGETGLAVNPSNRPCKGTRDVMTLNLIHRELKGDKRIDSQSPLTRGYIRLEDCLDLFNTYFGEVLDPRK